MRIKAKHSMTIRLINNAGSVIRVALVLERRGYSIESLQIKNFPEGYSEMSLICSGETEKFEQVQKQLSKLVDVIFVNEGIREQRRKEVSWTNSLTRVLTRSI